MKDHTTNNIFPKTLHVYNTEGGMIWQVYHVQTLAEASLLAYNATRNSYEDQILVDFTNEEETWPDWRPESKHNKVSMKALR